MAANCVLCGDCDSTCLKWTDVNLFDSFCFLLSLKDFTFDDFNSSDVCANCVKFLIESSKDVLHFKELQKKVSELHNQIKSILIRSNHIFSSLPLNTNITGPCKSHNLNQRICRELQINTLDQIEGIEIFTVKVEIEQPIEFTEDENFEFLIGNQLINENCKTIEENGDDFVPLSSPPPSSKWEGEESDGAESDESYIPVKTSNQIKTRGINREQSLKSKLTPREKKFLVKEAKEKISFIHLKRLESMTVEDISLAMKNNSTPRPRKQTMEFERVGLKPRTRKRLLSTVNESGELEFQCHHENCTYKNKIRKKVHDHADWVHNKKVRLGIPDRPRKSTTEFESLPRTRKTMLERNIVHRTKYPKEVNDDGTIDYLCSIPNCDYRNSHITRLYDHVKIKHREGKKELNTTVARAKLKPKLRKKYPSIMNEDGELEFHCPHENCPYKNKVRKKVHDHADWIHNKKLLKNKKEICPYCGKYNSNISVHIKNVHDVSEVTCDNCGVKRKNLFALNHHKKRCLRLKDLKCKLCDQTFIYGHRERLIDHMVAEHGQEPRVFACDQCPAKYRFKNFLAKHKRTVHPTVLIPCDVCGKQFSTAAIVNRHKAKVHLKMKRFVCAICGFKFFDRHQLTRHEKLHRNERPFLCSSCGKAFARKHALADHIKLRHID